MPGSAVAFVGRDNDFYLVLSKNGVALTAAEMASVTKWELKINEVYYDSDDYPLAFVADNDNSKVRIKPYSFGLSAMPNETVELILYDDEYTNGIVWDQFLLWVRDDAVPAS